MDRKKLREAINRIEQDMYYQKHETYGYKVRPGMCKMSLRLLELMKIIAYE